MPMRQPMLDYGFPCSPRVDACSRNQVDRVELPTGETVNVFVVVYSDTEPKYGVRYPDGYFHHSPLTGPQMVYHLRERSGLAPTSRKTA